MKLGLMIEGQEGLTWDRWRALMRAAEDLGFESLWRSDHFFSVMGRPERQCIETWVSLAVAATETSRVRFGALVSSMTFRHPALLARMAASVDQLSGGRLVMGVGAGWNVPEHEAFGFPLPPPKERLDRLEEGIEVILRLWAEGKANFDGRYYQLKDAEAWPKPAQRPHPPLLIGGGGEKRTLLITAKYADEWNSAAPLTPDGYRQKIEVLNRHCERVGRDPEAIAHSRMTAFLIGRSDAELAERCRALQVSVPSLAQVEISELPRTLLGRGWLVGTPEQVIEQIHAYEEAGCKRIMLQHHNQTDMEVLQLIAEEILPAVA
jgi:F420-dependent oxidoreductase-like protein